MNTLAINKSTKATNVRFDQFRLFVLLEDGREISIPLDWFPNIKNATEKQKKNWRLIGSGEGIHWEDLDEDILVEALL